MFTPKRLAFVAAMVVVCLAGSHARADIIAQLDSLGSAPSVNIYLAPHDGMPAVNTSYTPGQVTWKNLSNTAPLQSSFISFCVDVNQDVSIGGTYNYTMTTLENAPNDKSSTSQKTVMSAASAVQIRELWGGFYNSNFATDGTQAAAFQLAIWKIEYDLGDSSLSSSNVSFSSGIFQATPIPHDAASAAAIQDATNWLTLLEKNPNAYASANLMALTSNTYQDQVVAVPLPVPPSYALAGVGALCLCGFGIAKARSRMLKPIAV